MGSRGKENRMPPRSRQRRTKLALVVVACVLWAIVLAAILSGGGKKSHPASGGQGQPVDLVAHLKPDAKFYLLYKCLTGHSSLLVSVDNGNYYGVISNATGSPVAGIQYAGTTAIASKYAKETGNFVQGNITYYFPPGHDPDLGDEVVTCINQFYP
jgi:hypothetical protein